MLLQARLGCKRGCPAFSVEAACSGFIYALSVADKFIRAGEAKRALVVGAETLSRITDQTDRGTAILFGDGAGAVVLSARRGRASSPRTCMPMAPTRTCSIAPAASRRKGHGTMPAGDVIRMAGSEVFKMAVNLLGSVVDEALAANGLRASPPSTGWCRTRPTSASSRRRRSKLDMPMERVIVTVQEHGNTSTASVPLALDVGVRDGRIKRGELLLLEAFGGGFTWGSALVRY